MLPGHLWSGFLNVICFPSYMVENIVIGISLLSHYSAYLDVVGFPAAEHLMNTVRMILMAEELLVPILLSTFCLCLKSHFKLESLDGIRRVNVQMQTGC